MSISVFDLFKIGIGPSSSHTVGPMCAAQGFVNGLRDSAELGSVVRVKAEMYGSLGATGKGHGTPSAVMMGLEGELPETINVRSIDRRVEDILSNGKIMLAGEYSIKYSQKNDLVLHRKRTLPYHPNGMRFSAFDADKNLIQERVYYSVGGGFVVDEAAASADCIVEDNTPIPYPFDSAHDLLALCDKTGLTISQLMWENELAWRSEEEINLNLFKIWTAMQECVDNGVNTRGILPGGLKVKRRASELKIKLLSRPEAALSDPLTILDWVTLYALAVNEENAAGGRVVTAPTNGAAGIIPAVLHYYMRFVPGASDTGVTQFLLTAAAIGILYKKNASISGAEVGCQGEVGSACSMAAGALTAVMGGTPQQVENAAEIGMEHNLGLTCDPVGGLVQVPCIERNAMASVKAIHAARMALSGDGSHFVSLDKVILTMRKTGEDMHNRYKETARGGLAIHVLEMPVNITEC